MPGGFVVGAPTYAMFVDETGLRERIAERLRDLDVEDTAALEATAQDVRAMIETQAVPVGIRRSIADAYAELGGGEGASAPWRSARRPRPRTRRRRPSPA